jgi:mono/diheme cytochrome c family protein
MIRAALLSLLIATLAVADEGPLRGDPFRGRELLTEKQCIQCHSVWGYGGQLGPDISTAVAGKNWFELVGDFWNHTPRMIDSMDTRGYSWPTLDRREMADLLSYLYYLRLFDEPGDATRGSLAYAQQRCENCHSLGGRGGASGGPLDEFSAYPSPVMLAQAMWNAGPAMQQEQLARGRAIPMFSGKEMADIQAYIRTRALRRDREVQLLPLPKPSKGGEVFHAKRCVTCHRSDGRGSGPTLSGSAMHLTVSEISGILWNHSYAMNDLMRDSGIAFPRFEDTEIADLISYLQFLGFFHEQGDADRGQTIFFARGCSGCHSGPDATAIDLATTEAATDSIALSAAMWNHAPDMHELLAMRAVAWPKFDPGDMEHLAAYLRRLSREAQREGR